MILNNPHMRVYVADMGKIFLVSAIVQSVHQANELCERDSTIGVIADDENGLVYLAKLEGLKLSKDTAAFLSKL